MSDLWIELGNLGRVMQDESKHIRPEDLSTKVCLIALRFDSDNIEIAKRLTTEGMDEKSRVNYLQSIKNHLGREVFEFSTCNRILYVGFDIGPEELTAGVATISGISDIPFKHMTGSDAWKKLVNIASGLDSFIVGELQVMSQLRNAINFHRQHDLIGRYNLAFFDHIISANRIVRKELGFTSTTESMLNLATSSLEEILKPKGQAKSLVLGFGEMGAKAVETLQQSDQVNIIVASRNPEKSSARNPELASNCTMITYQEIKDYSENLDIVISTRRCSTPAYTKENPLPITSNATLLDFSWPPSIENDAVQSNQTLLGMDHWIKLARNLDQDAYLSMMLKAEELIAKIQNRYMDALSDRNEAKFRALIYGQMEELSTEWESSAKASQEESPQMGAFAREIATWICKQNKSFRLSELMAFIEGTNRKLSPDLLVEVSKDVQNSILSLSAGN